ncbi:type II toxin-antitoxin system RelE family toxin [Gordonia effusa]|uniref:type II toxin-antitoxin system RelE family toxin n=1 Tax=Gordonia effusa TaxID=263908 RepID=UPI0002E6B8B1|nr:type II toxin-antitoxin system RelE/ParE family toxin [Gordonia effusa]
MSRYTVNITSTARKELAKIVRANAQLGKQLGSAIDALADNPRPHGCKKLQSVEGYRIRVREYRVLYTVSDAAITVQVFRVSKRGAAY